MASGVFWASLWGPTGQPSPGGGLENAEIWDPPGRGLWTEAKKRETHYQTQRPDPKKGSRPPKSPRGPPEAPRRRPEAPRRRPEAPRGPREAPEASEAPEAHRDAKTRAPEARKPPEAPEAPGRFRSSEGHERKSPQPFRKILKGYRSARDKTLDRSQADKGGVGI